MQYEPVFPIFSHSRFVSIIPLIQVSIVNMKIKFCGFPLVVTEAWQRDHFVLLQHQFSVPPAILKFCLNFRSA